MKSKVKNLMKDKGITLRELMQLTGLANKTVLAARSDRDIRSCRLVTLEKIAQGLDCRIKDLFEEEKDV